MTGSHHQTRGFGTSDYAWGCAAWDCVTSADYAWGCAFPFLGASSTCAESTNSVHICSYGTTFYYVIDIILSGNKAAPRSRLHRGSRHTRLWLKQPSVCMHRNDKSIPWRVAWNLPGACPTLVWRLRVYVRTARSF